MTSTIDAVSIPLKSGHHYDPQLVGTWAKACSLNPFEIRASLRQKDLREMNQRDEVSIPLKSGHHYDHSVSCIVVGSKSLNPFEIRASLRHTWMDDTLWDMRSQSL